jgi:hypothetical protein
VQNFNNQISRMRLAPDLAAGVEGVITSELFQVPTTAARFGSRLAVVNAKFDTGTPPTADQYEVIVVDGEHGSPPYSSSRLIAGWPLGRRFSSRPCPT